MLQFVHKPKTKSETNVAKVLFATAKKKLNSSNSVQYNRKLETTDFFFPKQNSKGITCKRKIQYLAAF